MRKNLILYLMLILLTGAMPGYSQEPVEPEKKAMEETVTADQVQVISESSEANADKALKERVSSYLDKKAGQIPHHTFWERTRTFFHDFLYAGVERIFPQSWQTFLRSVVDIVFEIPLLIILLLLSFTFILNVFVVTVILVVVSYYKKARETYKENLNQRFEDVLTKYLFYDLSLEEVLKELKQVKTTLGRDLLIDIFFNYQRNLSGEYRDRILELYNKLELFNISARKIRSAHTYKRVKGIRELANMYPVGAKSLILKYVKDKNYMVRSEAQIAYAYLDEDTSFGFLNDMDQKLSTWVQLNILNYVKLHERDVPSFHRWIDSPNNDVQDFAIRMIDYFQQSENSEHLIRKLDHPNEQTRAYVYKAIRHLNLFEGKEPAKARFEDESIANKMRILKIIRDLGDEGDFSFLIGVLKSEDIQLKIQAVEAFYQMGESGRAFLKEYSETEDFDLKRFVEHIKDQRN